MSESVLDKLKDHLRGAVLDSHEHRGDQTAIIERSHLRAACFWLRDTEGLELDMLSDLTAVDYLALGREPRFEVVYHLYSVAQKHRIRLKVGVPVHDPTVDTVSDIWKVANWLEREVWDMYGIRFNNHPDLRRILMYEEFVGHPLRKDYPKHRHQPLFRRPQHEIDAVKEGRPGSGHVPGRAPRNLLETQG